MNVVNNKSFKKFLIVWIGQMVSSIGVGLTAFSLGVYAFEQTHTATSVSLITLFSFLPSILLRPVGGVLTDRYDRRAMMILGDLGSALGLLFILIVMLIGDIQLWQIYIGVTISSIFAGLQSPAYKASATDLLSEEEFSKGSGLVQLAESAKFLFSPIIAGFLLSITKIENILIINIFTFVVAILAVLVVKKNLQKVPKESENQNFLTDLKEGWNAISSTKGILLLVTIVSIITFYLGFLQTLIGPMILSFSDARTLGTFQSVSAIGMIISSLVIGIFSVSKKYSRMLVLGMVLAGVSFSLLGLTTNLYFIIGAGFIFLSALPFINTSADVLVRQNISNEKQGRVWGIIGILSQLGFVVAYSVAGFLADHVFNPLLNEGGLLAPSIGKIIGTGPGRGIGLLFIIAGVLVMILAGITSRIKSIKNLENSRSTQSE